MALYDAPPHRVTLHSVTFAIGSSGDAGGGSVPTFAVAQSAVPCSINTVSADERLLFAQMNIMVTHTIAILTSALTVSPSEAWKAVADDTSVTYTVVGIRAGRAYGGVPAFTYLSVQQQL